VYKYEKCNRNDGNDDSLLNCNIGWKKSTAGLALKASIFSQNALQDSFTSKWWFSFNGETWKFTKKRLSICRLKFEQSSLEKEVPEKGTFYG